MGDRVGDVSDGRVSRRRAPPEIISRGDNRSETLSAARRSLNPRPFVCSRNNLNRSQNENLELTRLSPNVLNKTYNFDRESSGLYVFGIGFSFVRAYVMRKMAGQVVINDNDNIYNACLPFIPISCLLYKN